MAGVEKIKEKILQESEAKANAILDDAKNQAAQVLEKAKARAAVKSEELRKKADAEAADKRKISNSMLELDMRKEILTTKQELIEEVFQKALAALSGMDSSEYEEMLYKLILSAVETGEEEIILSANDKNRLSDGFVSRLNEALVQAGKNGGLKISEETGNNAGGFMLKASGVEINYSFEALLRMFRDEIEPEVAAILF